MAISISNLTTGSDSTQDSAPYIGASATINPTSGSLILVAVGWANASGYSLDAGVYISTTGFGGSPTITQIGFGNYRYRRSFKVYAIEDHGGSSGTVTFYEGGAETFDDVAWCIDEVTGQDTTTPYAGFTKEDGGIGTYSSGDLDPTTGDTPDAGDATWSAVWLEGSSVNPAPEGGWTALGEVTGATGVRCVATAWDSGADTQNVWTWTGGSTGGAAAILTINAASGSSPQTINVTNVASTTSVENPSFDASRTLSVTPVASTSVVENPTLDATRSISVTTVESGSSVLNPSFDATRTISLTDVAAGTTVYNPTVSTSGEPQTINLTAVPSTTTVPAPSVQAVRTLNVTSIETGSAVYTPILQAARTINAATISTGTTVNNVAFVYDQTIGVTLVDNTVVVYDLTDISRSDLLTNAIQYVWVDSYKQLLTVDEYMQTIEYDSYSQNMYSDTEEG